MEPLDVALNELIKHLSQRFSSINEVTRELRAITFSSLPLPFTLQNQTSLLEPFFSTPIKRQNIAGLNILGVDGGLIVKQLAGMDLVMTRAVAAMFYHKKDRVVAKYYPSENPIPEFYINTALTKQDEIDKLATYKRLLQEYETLLHAIRRFHPDLILLDGAIAPLETEKSSSLLLQKMYQSVLALLREIYHELAQLQIPLIGVVKDSRSRIFTSLLSVLLPKLIRSGEALNLLDHDYRGVLRTSTDTLLMNTLLNKDERSTLIQETMHLGITNDFLMERIITYVKPSMYDIPLRLEFPAGPQFNWIDHDTLTGIVFSLCGQNEEYALPNVIIEADARARLSTQDIELLLKNVFLQSGVNTHITKRRNRSPF